MTTKAPRPVAGEVLTYLADVRRKLHGVANTPDRFELGLKESADVNEIVATIDE